MHHVKGDVTLRTLPDVQQWHEGGWQILGGGMVHVVEGPGMRETFLGGGRLACVSLSHCRPQHEELQQGPHSAARSSRVARLVYLLRQGFPTVSHKPAACMH